MAITTSDTTDLEKKNLEAHVDLCAERYKFLEAKLIELNDDMVKLSSGLTDVKQMLVKMNDKRNNQIMHYGGAAIGALLLVIGFLIKEYVLQI